MKKKYLKLIMPTALFFTTSIFIYDQIRRLGGIKDIFDIEDDSELQEE